MKGLVHIMVISFFALMLTSCASSNKDNAEAGKLSPHEKLANKPYLHVHRGN